MSSKAVNRVHQDISRLNKAKDARHKNAVELRHDERALKTDKKQLERHHDKYEKNHTALGKGRDKLATLKDSEQTLLKPLDQELQSVQQAYDASVDPTTGQGDPTLQLELNMLQQMEAGFKAQFDPKIASQQASVDALAKSVTQGRADIKGDRADIKHDQAGIKHGKKAAATNDKRVKADRKKAFKDLKPAEYKLGLKGTNKLRHELGLKSVDHVIRPGVPNVVGGQVGKWIAAAQTILKQHGIPLSKMNARDIATIIRFESAGNPKAVNNWDSNAAAGHPSKGLMQTIGPTFDSYKLPGHGKILDPVDNIIAGVRYAISRYGSISNVPGIRAVHAGGAYVGY